jgi:hypothetical protein
MTYSYKYTVVIEGDALPDKLKLMIVHEVQFETTAESGSKNKMTQPSTKVT